MNNLIRKKCIICENKLFPIHKFKNFPLYMGVSEIKNFKFNDMEWGNCKKCGCVQLLTLIPTEVLYEIPHNPAIGKMWENHNIQFCNLIKNYIPNKILDIGGANLKLANLISKDENIKKYDVVDFSAKKYKTKKINEKINLFTCSAEKYIKNNIVDCIILSHTLEHIYEPVKFLKKIKKCLSEDGKIFISVPNIKNQLNDGFLNAMHFEHTYFIDHEYIEMILGRSGFKLIKKIDFSEYNSFYVFSKCDPFKINHKSPKDAINIFNNFIINLQKDINYINNFIKEKKIYIFGAHIFTQYLINFGIKIENIVKILDNDNNKIEKFLYGYDIQVSNPNIINDVENPIILLRVAQYKEEIMEQIKNINNMSIFI